MVTINLRVCFQKVVELAEVGSVTYSYTSLVYEMLSLYKN